MKIVINTCFGGFNLSHQGVMEYARLKGVSLYPLRAAHRADGTRDYNRSERCPESAIEEEITLTYTAISPESKENYEEHRLFFPRNIPRDDRVLVTVVEKLGNLAGASATSRLKVVTIPDGVEWEIREYDGKEQIVEKSRSWS